MRLQSPALVATIAALSLFGAACGSDAAADEADPGYVVTGESTLGPGDSVPAPTGDVVLVLTGDISTTNVDDRLEFDLATLESIGTVAYSVFDEQATGVDVEFEGVLLSDLLAVAGAGADATILHTTALNDYAIEIPVADASESPVMLATRADGAEMTIDQYGPTRIVYPYESHDLDPAIYGPRWIWQLASIDVR